MPDVWSVGMRTLGVILIVIGVGWALWDLSVGPLPRGRLKLVTSTVGFEGSAKLPPERIEAALNDAKGKVDSKVTCSDWYGGCARGADWVAFLLTGVITLIGGILGLSPGQDSGAPEAEAIATRSARLGRVVAFMAALAAVITAAGAKCQTTSDALYKRAEDMHRVALSVRKDVYEAKSKSEAQTALAQLDALRGGCSAR